MTRNTDAVKDRSHRASDDSEFLSRIERYCESCGGIHPTEEGAVNLLCENCGAAIEAKPRPVNPDTDQEGFDA